MGAALNAALAAYRLSPAAYRVYAAPSSFTPGYNIYDPNAGLLNPQGAHFMGYYSGFLPTGTGQSSAGPSILSSITAGLETFLPAIFGSRQPAVRTPPMLPGGTGGIPAVPIGTTTGQSPQSHPVLTTIGAVAGGTAVAVGTTMGGVALQHAMTGGGHRGVYYPPGTKGTHMIKKGPHAGQWTRNRHRNVANIRALRRALSRAHGFERIARKVMHFCSPHKARGRPVFRRRRRSK